MLSQFSSISAQLPVCIVTWLEQFHGTVSSEVWQQQWQWYNILWLIKQYKYTDTHTGTHVIILCPCIIIDTYDDEVVDSNNNVDDVWEEHGPDDWEEADERVMSLVAAWVWDYLCWSRLVVVAGHHVLTVIISRVSLITLSTLTPHSQVKPGTTVIQEKYKNIKWVQVQINLNWEGNVRVTHRKFSWLQSWCQCWVVRCYDMWSDGIDLFVADCIAEGCMRAAIQCINLISSSTCCCSTENWVIHGVPAHT